MKIGNSSISKARQLTMIRFIILTVDCLLQTNVNAAPDCNPQSIVARAVGGELFNQLLGGLNSIAGGVAGVNNGISPTPSSLLAECILPQITPPPPVGSDEDPSLVRPPAGGWSDPHLITHDGLGFDFQGAGDYAYVESDNLVVHARQFRLSRNAAVSRIKAFAVRFDDTTLIINDPIDASLVGSEPGLLDVITINGEDVPIGLGGWIDLDDQGSFIMRFRSHTFLSIKQKLRLLVTRDDNAFRLLLDESLREGVTGLLENFDADPTNDLQTATGTRFPISDVTTLYGEYLEGWLRAGEESLFNSPYDPMTEGNIQPGPLSSLANVDVPVRETAKQRCVEAGVADGFALHGCIYDLVFD